MFKRLMLFSFITVGVLTALFPTIKPTAAQSSRQETDIPYLMAFSDSPAPHFVIERADGSDSRDFATNIMPSDTNLVDGAGWSPSGQWYAWTAQNEYNMGDSGAKPYILGADGVTRPTGLDDMNRVGMAWSPVGDLLAVVGLVNPPAANFDPSSSSAAPVDVTYRIGLFDPATDAFVVSQEFDSTYDFAYDYWLDYRVEWAADGSYFLGVRNQVGVAFEAPAMQFYGLGPDLPFFETTIPATDLLYNIQSFREMDFRDLIVSPNAEVVQFDANRQAALVNLATQASTPLNMAEHEVITKLKWSEDGSQALIETLKSCAEADCPQNTAYRYADGTLTEVLPARPSPANLYPAPDLNKAILVELIGGVWDVSYLNLADLSLTPLDLYADIRPTVFLQWTGNQRVVIATEHGSEEVDLFTAFDFSAGVTTLGQFTLPIPPYSETIPAVAPNSLVAYLPDFNLNRVELSTGEVTTLAPDPRRYFTSNRGYAKWHPTQDYAFLFEDALVAGGGAPIYTDVVSADGSVHRPLGRCELETPRCIEWLPSQVDPTTLAPGHDNIPLKPLMTIPIGRWPDDLIWSPDGTQIAVGNEMRWYAEPGAFDVYDFVTGELVTTLPDVTYDQTITWQDGQAVVVNREVTPPNTYPRILAALPDGSLTVQIGESDETGFGDRVEFVDATGQPMVTIQDTHLDWHTSASIDQNGVWVALSSAYSPVRLYDAATGDLLYEMPLVYSNAVALTPDGGYLAVAYGTEIRIYTLQQLLESGME